VYVRVAFRPGHPEISPANRIFSGLRGSPFLLEGAADADIHPGVSPEPDDVIITKHRVGAFWGTDLDQVLRAKGIDTLILAGYATSGVVLTTVGDAADKDYYISVLSDCVTDNNQEVHQTLLTSVFPSQALVQTSDEFAESL
jgi:nicotinamidase-related amidase